MKPARIENRELLDTYHERPCVICRQPSDPCHIQSRGAGGDDVESNLIALCRYHHAMQHQFGWAKFMQLYPPVYQELKRKGWALDEYQRLRRV